MTKEERKDWEKEYRKINADKISQRRKEKYLNLSEEEKEKILLKAKEHYLKNKETINDKTKEYRKEWNKLNAEKISEHKKEKYLNLSEEEKKLRKEKAKEYYEENKDVIHKNRKEYRKQYEKERRLNDPLFRLSCNIRVSISASLKKSGFKKLSRTEQILECSFENFKKHLESKFEDWMTWDNYGLYNGTERYGWDIDHIIPTSSATTEIELLNLNHYTNLQPLCSYNNRDIKRDIILYS